MNDLFEHESAVLQHAQSVLKMLTDDTAMCYQELTNITSEYESLLRQAKLLVRFSDLTTTGLNSDKLDLLSKVNIDELTKIYNRRFLEENLTRYINLLCRTNGDLSLLMLDLDFFKNFNDTYGHTAGDVCLKKVAATLQSAIRGSEDFVARYGGEEFVIVLTNTDKLGAMRVAERILESVRQLQIPHGTSPVSPYVTVSIGVTSATARQLNEAPQYISRADIALYHSKRTGRNRITYFPFEEELL